MEAWKKETTIMGQPVIVPRSPDAIRKMVSQLSMWQPDRRMRMLRKATAEIDAMLHQNVIGLAEYKDLNCLIEQRMSEVRNGRVNKNRLVTFQV